MVNVPNKTSEYKIEPKHKKYTIHFASELIDLLSKGEKIKTYRFGTKYEYLQVGDNVNLSDLENKKIIGEAKITDKERKLFKDIPVDNTGHEEYRDKEHQREVFSGYYAYLGRKIKDDDMFLVFTFESV